MKIYHYDPNTKEYLGSSDARLDPLESSKQQGPIYLIPANATTIVPPPIPEGKTVLLDNKTWIEVDKPSDPGIEPHVETEEEKAEKEKQTARLKAIEDIEKSVDKIEKFSDIQEVVKNLLIVLK